MVANDPHNRKPPLLLGFIAMISGILLAFFVLDMVHAGDRMDLLQEAPFLISSDIDNTIYSYRVGSNVIMPMRIGYGYITPNVNDNNNAAVTFLDEFTIDYTTTNSWEDKQSVYRKGFAYDNFGIVYGELFAPNTGGITEWTTETFHVSKNQYTSVISAPPCPYHKMTDGYYQIYFSDVDIDLPESVDLGRGRYFCISIPQEHYNEFVLTTNSFNYPYLDLYVSYYDFTLNQWLGLLPVERFHELLDGYVLAYADRSLKISCNNSSVFVNASQFQVNIPTSTPSPTPTPDPNASNDVNVFIRMGSSYYMYSIVGTFLDDCVQPNRIGSTDNYALLLALENENLTNVFVQPNFIYQDFATYKLMYIYIMASSVEKCFRYDINSDLVSSDPEVIKNSISPLEVDIVDFNSNLNLACLKLNWTDRYSDIRFLRSDYHIPFYDAGTFNFNSYDAFLYNSSNTANPLYRTYLGGLRGAPSPTPDPNATPTPEPSATPTPPPYVIIITPDPSPTPTPPFIIPTMPPWNPPGNQIVPLNPEIQEDVFGEFTTRLGDNNAFGLIGLLIGLLPGDLMWYLWFLLFVLLVVGVSKLIIHFTGG